MVAPIILLTNGCSDRCLSPRVTNGQANRSSKIFTAMVALDIAVLITTFVVGMLSITATIYLSFPLTYALLSVGSLVLLSYSVMLIKGCHLAKTTKERDGKGGFACISLDITKHFKVVPQVLCACMCKEKGV